MTGPSEERLAEWQRLAGEATEGPWGWGGSGVAGGEGGEVLIAKTDWSDVEGLSVEVMDRNRRNGRFIAAAREAVPALLADRAALAARLAEVERNLDWFGEREAKVHRLYTETRHRAEQAEAERDDARSALGRVEDYVTTVERIHNAYRHLVMDTDEDRERHARLIDVADRALALSRAALRGEAGEGRA